MKKRVIPFNKPCLAGTEIENITKAINTGKIAGDGEFTVSCQKEMEKLLSAKKVLLTTSGSDALELSAILYGLGKDDEVIMPSFTFVSTANAFCIRGANPIFVDIDEQTLNIDPALIEKAITEKTKAIVPVHYAGVSCDMDSISTIAAKYDLRIIEDACHAFLCNYKGKALGTIGDVGCFSFHETKTFISGEGGAIVLNNEEDISRAEILREKGTNRSAFFRGDVDKYTWVDIGSSFLPSDIISAFLYGQIKAYKEIIKLRNNIFELYHTLLEPLEILGNISRIKIPSDCDLIYHMYFLLVDDLETRTKLIKYLRDNGIHAVFHFVPLHSAPYAKKIGINIKLPVTDNVSNCIVRLPFYNSIVDDDIEYVVSKIYNFFNLKLKDFM